MLVYAPGPRETIEGVTATRSRLLVAIYRNVRGSAVAYRFDDGGWQATPLPLPENASVSLIVDERPRRDARFSMSPAICCRTRSISPISAPSTAEPVKSLPARFDASKAVVEQFDAISKDGTANALFRRAAARPRPNGNVDGNAPTLLYGYGGFQVSMNPGLFGRARQICGSSRAASMSSPISAAAASSARNGTRPRSRSTASAPMTISSPSPRI